MSDLGGLCVRLGLGVCVRLGLGVCPTWVGCVCPTWAGCVCPTSVFKNKRVYGMGNWVLFLVFMQLLLIVSVPVETRYGAVR